MKWNTRNSQWIISLCQAGGEKQIFPMCCGSDTSFLKKQEIELDLHFLGNVENNKEKKDMPSVAPLAPKP